MKVLKLIPLFFVCLIAFNGEVKAEDDQKDFSMKLVKIRPNKAKKNTAIKNQQKSSGRKPASKGQPGKMTQPQSRFGF